MKSFVPISFILSFLLHCQNIFSQQSGFTLALSSGRNFGGRSFYGTITDIKQDSRGYLWLSTAYKGLQRFDGVNMVSYLNDPNNPNSLSKNRVPCLYADSSGIIWAATYGGGLDQFDPVKNQFIHFRHEAKDASSLSNDTVFVVLRDHLGILWVGTYGGLDRLDEKSGKFTHFRNIPGDNSSLSYNRIWHMYEDRQGVLWVGCGSPFLTIGESPEEGGLNRFDRATGKFTRYLHDSKDSNSIVSNKVRAIFEDSRGNFWVGSTGDGLQIMDRKTGRFTLYKYDPLNPDKLSAPPVKIHETFFVDQITFISEDMNGSIWIGSDLNGTNKYDPVTKKITHFDLNFFRSYSSGDGLMWFSTSEGELYHVDPSKNTIPYYTLSRAANSLYFEEDKKVLWIGGAGLMRKDLNTRAVKTWIHEPLNNNSLCNDTITGMKADGKGNLWMATLNGLCKFDLHKEIFTTYRHIDKDSASISGNRLFSLFVDRNKNIWTSSGNWIVEKLNSETGVFTHYRYNTNANNLISDYASCFAEDHKGDVWIGTRGLIRLDHQSGKLNQYLPSSVITNIYVDQGGVVWTGNEDGLFRYDPGHDRFLIFTDPNSGSEIKGVINISEDKNRNLWISTNRTLLKINDQRNEVRIFGERYGVHENTMLRTDNYQSGNGELFFGDQAGYYAFFPDSLRTNNNGPVVNLTGFKVNDREINAEANGILYQPLRQVKEIQLKYNQNNFSFTFNAIDFRFPGEMKYFFMLENYGNNWHYNGNDTSAYWFKIPPGNYRFKVKAVNPEGYWSEESVIIHISPPWWNTLWAYILYGILFVSAVWGFIHYRSLKLRRENRLLEEKVTVRTNQLQQEKEKVEATLTELKSTQAQLIQSEKMASLGELTAGIAHEIQNPLNFVNNFSEVNKELLAEMNEEILKGNYDEVKVLAKDLTENEEKIGHHGKRADSIVKSMLQHSQLSSGKKEPADINALANEYFGLAYHGIRAKDKSFNASLQADFDKTIGTIHIIPQDIGRVLLNLYNNAFYAVNEKKTKRGEDFEPAVSVTTTNEGKYISISVKDNGDGIPRKVLDKIFQPFFTTKPTGQGTGLGLSLSYDIVKAHGGEIRVNTKEGEFTEFVVQLPKI